jgi:hypothetical protein
MAFLLIGQAFLGSVFQDPIQSLLYAGAPLSGAIGGLVVGGGQWLSLRRHWRGAEIWILATMIGWAGGFTLALQVFVSLLPGGIGYLSLLIPFAIGGAMAGLFQVIVLRRKYAESTPWWVAASAMGWALGWVAALALSGTFLGRSLRWPGLGISLMGAVHGAVIGLESAIALLALSALAAIPSPPGGQLEGSQLKDRVSQRAREDVDPLDSTIDRR